MHLSNLFAGFALTVGALSTVSALSKGLTLPNGNSIYFPDAVDVVATPSEFNVPHNGGGEIIKTASSEAFTLVRFNLPPEAKSLGERPYLVLSNYTENPAEYPEIDIYASRRFLPRTVTWKNKPSTRYLIWSGPLPPAVEGRTSTQLTRLSVKPPGRVYLALRTPGKLDRNTIFWQNQTFEADWTQTLLSGIYLETA